MKKISILIAALLSIFAANAENFEVDSIEYYLEYPAAPVVAVYKCWKTSGSVVVPEYVTYYGRTYEVNEIRPGAFTYSNNAYVSSISLPNTLTDIGGNNFQDLENLLAIEIPSSVKEIGGGCFNNCKSLTTVNCPEAMIGGYSFNHCPNIVSVTIASCGEECFSNDSSLAEVVVDGGYYITRIGRKSFMNCPGLKKVTISYLLERVGELCFACTSQDPDAQYAQIDTVVILSCKDDYWCNGQKLGCFLGHVF